MVGIAEEADRLRQKKGKFFKPIFPIQYRKMWKVRNKTLADLMNDYVKDPALQNILDSLSGYYGVLPSKLSGFYYAVATGGYLKNGSQYVNERSPDLSYALADVIDGSGGKILYETLVQNILVKNGAVQGVGISGGKVLPARAVVSNASALTTFKKMLPHEVLPADYLKKLNGYRPSLSTFIVWLGLNQELKGKIKGYSFYVGSGRGPEAEYQSFLKGEIDRGSFGVTVYDNVFEGYSPPGTLVLLFLCGYEPWRKVEADYRTGHKDAYYKEKQRWTEILICRADEKVVPALSSMIEVKEAATLLTNWRYTRNLEGAIYGFEQSMDNSFMKRIDNRTPYQRALPRQRLGKSRWWLCRGAQGRGADLPENDGGLGRVIR